MSEVTDAIAVFDKSATRTTPNAQTAAWAVLRAELVRLLAIAEAVEERSDAADGVLNRLEGWAKAYPVDIFSEVTDDECDWLHATKPGLIDRISARMGRHMAACIAEDVAKLRTLVAWPVGGREEGNGQ